MMVGEFLMTLLIVISWLVAIHVWWIVDAGYVDKQNWMYRIRHIAGIYALLWATLPLLFVLYSFYVKLVFILGGE